MFNLDDRVNNMILNYAIGQVTVQILTPLDWYGILLTKEVKNRNPKLQSELENAANEACSNLSLNVVRSCIKKDSNNTLTCCIFILIFYYHFVQFHLRYQNISKKILFDYISDVLDQKCHSQGFYRR